jgi:hypothetical protein
MQADNGEGRRQAYLAALGIPLWSLRAPLPGALPGESLQFVPYQSPVTEALLPDAPAPEPLSSKPSSSESSFVAPAVRPPPARVEESTAPARPAVAAEDRFPRFLCRIQALAPGWSAVVMLGDAPDLSAQEHRLLANIASALGGDSTAVQPCEHLRWPLNRNPTLDHGVEAMVEWLAHALKLPPGHCLVFGEQMAAYVRAALPRHTVIAAPALGTLLAHPAVKRLLAQALNV